MRQVHAASNVLLLLVGGLCLLSPGAMAQARAPGALPQLPADARARLTEAAQDSKLASWQREFMLGVARDESGATASPSAPGRSASPSMAQSGGDDGLWVSAPQPSARFCHTAIYDPVRVRMIVFAGYDGSFRNDVWALSLSGTPLWSELTPSGTAPIPRNVHTAIYDPVRDRMVVCGGYDLLGNYLSDVWALTLSGSPAWSNLAPSGTSPSGRGWHSAIYDPVRDRMLMFGGRNAGPINNELWQLTLGASPAWTELSPSGTLPAVRFSHAVIYDPVRDRMLVFGGDGGNGYRNDFWELTLAGGPAWNELTVTGTPPTSRPGHAAIYDPVCDNMVVFGGYDGSFLNDVWTLNLANGHACSELVPPGPEPAVRGWHTAILDPVRGELVTFGGENNPSALALKDVWTLSLTPGSPVWNSLGGGIKPGGRISHAAIVDPIHHRMVVFGGDDGVIRNDVWVLSLPGIPSWAPIVAGGTPPSPRRDHTAIYDLPRDRMVVFGGRDGNGFYNDVWALSLGEAPAWTSIVPIGTPPPARCSQTAIYDPIRERMVIFGGTDSLVHFNDAWELTLAGIPRWSELYPTGSLPTGRIGATAIYDPVGDVMVLFGGKNGTYLNDLWTMTLVEEPAWSQLTTSGTPPTPRGWHTAVHDQARGRMVVLGGWDGGSRNNDSWALSLGGSLIWSELDPTGGLPAARFSHTAVYDRERDEMVLFGGDDGLTYRDDLWLLQWGTTLSVPGPGGAVAGRFELSRPRPNPSRADMTVDLDLAEPARVALDVFDTQGRRVRQITDEFFTAGRHAVTWRGDDETGRPLATGVYFIRMHGRGFQATRRALLVR